MKKLKTKLLFIFKAPVIDVTKAGYFKVLGKSNLDYESLIIKSVVKSV